MEHQWTRCYRMRPFFRNVGLFCTIFSAAFGLVSILAAYFNVDGSFARPELAALCSFLFSSVFTLLGIFLLVRHRNYRLFINDSSVRQVDVICDRQIDVGLVDELKWQCFPKGGSARMSGVGEEFFIEFDHFNNVDRAELVTLLRQAILESRQIGWEQFNERFADTPEKQSRTRRARVRLTLVFGVQAVAFGVAWAVSHKLPFLIPSVVLAVVVAYLIKEHLQDQIK